MERSESPNPAAEIDHHRQLVIKSLVTQTIEVALAHGVIARNEKHRDEVERHDQSVNIDHARLTLWPSRIPKTHYTDLLQIQTDFNLLLDKISQNKSFLLNSLQQVCQHDEFIRRLVQIYNEVDDMACQSVTFGVHRCDYMLHVDDNGETDPSGKLVEINTIAVSGFGYSQEIALIHKFIQHQHQDQDTVAKHYSGEVEWYDSEAVICNAMALAWQEYKQPRAALLMVVKENEVNIYGQRRFESMMVLSHKIKVIRHSLTELHEIATLNKDKKLIVNGTEVALVYYRAGYDPVSYPCDKEWNVRSLIENSRAIKCPSISYHLLTTKKIQQVLSNQNVLECFLDDPAMIQRIRSTFVGQYSLDKDTKGDKAVEMALKSPEKFVLKPQREGGGNNYFDDALKDKLLQLKESEERAAYILMDRINPPSQHSMIISSGCHYAARINSEIGIYGVFIRNEDEILLNSSAGHLVRSKPASDGEGGCLNGAGALNSIILTS